jgi:predicted esterase
MEPECTRRQLLGLGALVWLAGCRTAPATAPTTSDGSFQLSYGGRSVRCLFCASSPTTVPPLAVVLLHGAGADASQWTDIGLTAAVEDIAAGHPTSLVAVAPDVGDSVDVSALVLDGVLPAVEQRWRPHGAAAISGISRGGGQALQTVLRAPRRFSSLGLHSPALPSALVVPPGTVPVFIDAGDRDPLRPPARRLADELRRVGVDVTTQWDAGGHDRPYWRAHLAAYLAFHLVVHETTT